MTCNHELNCIDESWIDENKVKITMKCDVCKERFSGELKNEK